MSTESHAENGTGNYPARMVFIANWLAYEVYGLLMLENVTS